MARIELYNKDKLIDGANESILYKRTNFSKFGINDEGRKLLIEIALSYTLVQGHRNLFFPSYLLALYE